MAGGEERRAEEAPLLGELIAMRFPNFADEAVGTKKSELSPDAGSESSHLGWRGVGAARAEDEAEVAASEAGGREIASRDRLEQGEIGGVADARRAGAPATVGGRPCDTIEELGDRRLIMDCGEGVEVGLGLPRSCGHHS